MTHEENIKLLVENGVKRQDAEVIIECFETADLYGVKTHGLLMLNSHLERIKRGGYNLNPSLNIIRQTDAFALVDGDNGIGPIIADFCMKYAVDKCRTSGIYTVLSRNNNTFGPAFYYPLKAAEEGMIGFICSNSPAQMAPVGGREKMLGTNPFAAVIPVPDSDPIIIDMATSIVAKSRFKEYKENGLPLPTGWALDENGDSTTDPDKAIRGLVLPMAGYKGYAIAMLIDIIAGALSGAAFLNRVGRFYDSSNQSMNVGFYVVAINPELVFDGDYENVITEYVDILRKSSAKANCKITLPGDDRIFAKNKGKGQENETNSNF